MAITGVSFKGEDQKKSSPAGGAIAGAAIGAATGYGIGAKQDAKYILKADKFELSEKQLEKYKGNTEAEKAIEEIKNLKAASSKEAVDKAVAGKLEELDVKGDVKEADVAKFLGLDKAPEKIEDAITAEKKLGEAAATKITETKPKFDTATTAFDTAKTAKEAADKGKDEAAKKTAQEAFDKAEKELKEAATPFEKATTEADASAKTLKKLELVKAHATKEGKLPKAALETHYAAEVLAENESKLTKALKNVKLPKVHPAGKIAIFAAIGLALGALLTSGGSKKAPQAEEPKA